MTISLDFVMNTFFILLCSFYCRFHNLGPCRRIAMYTTCIIDLRINTCVKTQA